MNLVPISSQMLLLFAFSYYVCNDEIELAKMGLLPDFQRGAKKIKALPTAIVLDWFTGFPN